MLMQTISKTLWFVSLVLPVSPCLAAQITAEPVRLTISVHNDANVPATAMAFAEVTAARIFRQAGLVVKWIICAPSRDTAAESTTCSETEFPRHLQVRIMSQPRNAPHSTFGVSYLAADGTGCYSDIFFMRIIDLHSRSGQDIGAVLGHVMAHEIAHLLLGMSSHSPFGIMRAQWQKEELLKASKGELLFTEDESQLMRQRLSMARQAVGD
ncbi:MAG: hypothetical protein JWO71_2568 [Candidatus Acidoferrum typicum]|nr:hypothetical protein [Candidatus Acidoferrum typicum]